MQPIVTNANLKKVVIHSDGGCHGNPGPGGWAAVVASGGRTCEISGGVSATTNNRMELMAAIEALKSLTEPCEVQFHTDSSYLKNGVTAWLRNWKRNGWQTKTKEPVKNADLWRLLDSAVSTHTIQWHWVKGHAGHAGNERCDALANEEIARIKKVFNPAQLKEHLAEFVAQEGSGKAKVENRESGNGASGNAESGPPFAKASAAKVIADKTAGKNRESEKNNGNGHRPESGNGQFEMFLS